MKKGNGFKSICNCIIMLMFFVSCASKTNNMDTAKSDDTEYVEITSELTTEEATTEDPDLLPIEVDYEPVEYDKYPRAMSQATVQYIDDYWRQLIWPEWVTLVGMTESGDYIDVLNEDKTIDELITIYPFIDKYDANTRIIKFKSSIDWIWDRRFVYGMEDPVIIDFFVDYYNAEYDKKIDKSRITAESFDFFNYNKPVYIDGGGVDYDTDSIFWFDNDTLNDIASYNDQKVTRAIMVSLGRSYFTQEIPYSFFADKLGVEEGILEEYTKESQRIINNLYSDSEILTYYYDTQREFVFGTSNNKKDSSVGTYKEMMEKGQYDDFGFFERINEGDYLLHISPFPPGIFKHYDITTNWGLGNTADTVDISTSNVKGLPSYEYREELLLNKIMYPYVWEEVFEEESSETIQGLTESIDIPGINTILRNELPPKYIAFSDCCMYNNQFYIIAYHPKEINTIFRDDSNGAISMELSDDEQRIVIDAYEKAGTPLQTDGEGHIAVETPAHYKEVYGVDYRDVLKEAGLE